MSDFLASSMQTLTAKLRGETTCPGALQSASGHSNPFNPTTVVSDVKLVVFDIVGCEVAVLVYDQS